MHKTKHYIMLTLDPETHNAVREIAASKKRSITGHVRELVLADIAKSKGGSK